MAPPHTQLFEDAIPVNPISSHQYSTSLHPHWVVGAVPHGGYTLSVLHRLATVHFKHTHPTRHSADPMPISMQMNYLRRTEAGPALLTVEDSKLGVRTSTIHVTLSQEGNAGGKKKQIVKLVGYITVSDPVSDTGVTTATAWELRPPPPSTRPPPSLEDGGGVWRSIVPTAYTKFRKVENHMLTFVPATLDPYGPPRVGDQWTRLRTLDLDLAAKKKDESPRGGLAKWTNEAAVFLSDWYPTTLEALGGQVLAATSPDKNAKPKPMTTPLFWYPTVTLNIEFKKRLPPEGVDWLYSRTVIKSVRNGRMDIEATVMDEAGDIVLVGSQIGLVLSAERNISGRNHEGARKAAL